jgi:hypothetical protein
MRGALEFFEAIIGDCHFRIEHTEFVIAFRTYDLVATAETIQEELIGTNFVIFAACTRRSFTRLKLDPDSTTFRYKIKWVTIGAGHYFGPSFIF